MCEAECVSVFVYVCVCTHIFHEEGNQAKKKKKTLHIFHGGAGGHIW